MKAPKSIVSLTAAAIALMARPAPAQEPGPDKIPKQDENAALNPPDAQKVRNLLAVAMANARQIGLTLFEFENEYAGYPSEKTVAYLKQASGSESELKAVTANDCFYQLMAGDFVTDSSIFTFQKPAAGKPTERGHPPAKLEKCDFAYLSGMNAAGNPARPLVVAPLVKGKTVFDPKIFGGKAIILRVDNSVQALPIEPDGRVLIDGKETCSTPRRDSGKAPSRQ